MIKADKEEVEVAGKGIEIFVNLVAIINTLESEGFPEEFTDACVAISRNEEEKALSLLGDAIPDVDKAEEFVRKLTEFLREGELRA